jgi:hypothetical protein
MVITGILNADENQLSWVTVIGSSFPSLPAGITRVVRVPLASNPLIVFMPRFSISGLAISALTVGADGMFELTAPRIRMSPGSAK